MDMTRLTKTAEYRVTLTSDDVKDMDKVMRELFEEAFAVYKTNKTTFDGVVFKNTKDSENDVRLKITWY
jgi:hypothetical protein